MHRLSTSSPRRRGPITADACKGRLTLQRLCQLNGHGVWVPAFAGTTRCASLLMPASGNLGADAADAGGGRLLLLDMEAADFRGAVDMRPAAEFQRDVADFVNRNLVAVAVGEQSDRAGGTRLLQRHHG